MYRSDHKNEPLQQELYSRVARSFRDQDEELRNDRARRHGRQEALPPPPPFREEDEDRLERRRTGRYESPMHEEDGFGGSQEFRPSPRQFGPQLESGATNKYMQVVNQIDRRVSNKYAATERQRVPDDRLDYPQSAEEHFRDRRDSARPYENRNRPLHRNESKRDHNETLLEDEEEQEENYGRAVDIIDQFERKLSKKPENVPRRSERRINDSFSPESSGNFSPRSFDQRTDDDLRGNPVKRTDSRNDQRYSGFRKAKDPAHEASDFLDVATKLPKREPSFTRGDQLPKREPSFTRGEHLSKHRRQGSSTDSVTYPERILEHSPNLRTTKAHTVYPERIERKRDSGSDWAEESVTDFRRTSVDDNSALLRPNTRPYGVLQTHVNPAFDDIVDELQDAQDLSPYMVKRQPTTRTSTNVKPNNDYHLYPGVAEKHTRSSKYGKQGPTEPASSMEYYAPDERYVANHPSYGQQPELPKPRNPEYTNVNIKPITDYQIYSGVAEKQTRPSRYVKQSQSEVASPMEYYSPDEGGVTQHPSYSQQPEVPNPKNAEFNNNIPRRPQTKSVTRAIEQLDNAILTGEDPRSNFNAISQKSNGTSNIPQTYSIYPPSEDKASTIQKFELEERDDEKADENRKHHNMHPCMTFMLIVAGTFIVWDGVNDWLFNTRFPTWTCNVSNKLSTYNLSLGELVNVCSDKKDLMELLINIATYAGTVISVFQICNIIVALVAQLKGSKFKGMSGLSELQFAIYVREIPQVLLALFVAYPCDCENNNKLFTTLVVVSGFVSCLFRYLTAFGSWNGKSGFCNLWWRCLCCNRSAIKDSDDDATCGCNMPLSCFCLTLRCQGSRCIPLCWYNGLCKRLSCCTGCNKDKEQFGLRIMSNIGLLLLFCALVAQIIILVL